MSRHWINSLTGTLQVKVARRNDFLGSSEAFFGVYKQPGFIDAESDKACKFYRELISRDKDVKAVTIYGELFGGTIIPSTCIAHLNVVFTTA